MNERSEYSQYIKETSKVSEIVDKFGNLRFKVVLDDKQLSGQYFVLVLAYINGNEEELLRQQFPVLDQAVEFFDRTVEKYVYLIKSEQYAPHDIRVYADRIGYRRIYPECCFMCKWSKPCAKDDKLFADDDPEQSYNFLCMHPTQFKQRDGRKEDQQIDIHPVVYAFCTCNSYASAIKNENKESYNIKTGDYEYRLPE